MDVRCSRPSSLATSAVEIIAKIAWIRTIVVRLAPHRGRRVHDWCDNASCPRERPGRRSRGPRARGIRQDQTPSLDLRHVSMERGALMASNAELEERIRLALEALQHSHVEI